MRLGVCGSSGKMGQMIIQCCLNDSSITELILHTIEDFNFALPKNAVVVGSFDDLLQKCDGVIDFSAPKATNELLNKAAQYKKPLVIGTTGLDDECLDKMQEVSKQIPILYSRNMSLGVAVLNRLVKIAAKSLKDFDIEIIEQHHNLKKDAPSGTALSLGESAAQARDLDLKEVMKTSRDGMIGQRSKDEIGMFALRGGSIAGRHRVGFYGNGEFLELSHEATSREIFANGAIKAFKWLILQDNGLYSIDDCLK